MTNDHQYPAAASTTNDERGGGGSARDRQLPRGDTWTPRVLAIAVTAGFFGVMGWLLVMGKPDEGGDATLVLLGALGSAFTAVVAYYFGSSAGSAAKSQVIGAQINTQHHRRGDPPADEPAP